MTKNDEKFRSKAVALDFFPPLHPVILVSFNHKNCHPYTIQSFSFHPVIQRSENKGGPTLASLRFFESLHPPPSAEGGGWSDLPLRMTRMIRDEKNDFRMTDCVWNDNPK